jgi:hypothetical protein
MSKEFVICIQNHIFFYRFRFIPWGRLVHQVITQRPFGQLTFASGLIISPSVSSKHQDEGCNLLLDRGLGLVCFWKMNISSGESTF